jgi:hypothetical protein
MWMSTQPDSASPSHWQVLASGCTTAIRLSEAIGARLRQGATAGEFIPLLHRQSDAVGQLQTGIRDLLRQPRHPQDGRRREELVRQLSLLLELEHGNHQLLARRGIRLRGLRPGGRR